jgi:hypothetical protein
MKAKTTNLFLKDAILMLDTDNNGLRIQKAAMVNELENVKE